MLQARTITLELCNVCMLLTDWRRVLANRRGMLTGRGALLADGIICANRWTELLAKRGRARSSG